jgi:hypothetical protein
VNKTLIGIILIVVGAVLLLIGIKGYQKEEELFGARDFFSFTATRTKTVPVLKYIGSGVIGAGAILVITGFTKRK